MLFFLRVALFVQRVSIFWLRVAIYVQRVELFVQRVAVYTVRPQRPSIKVFRTSLSPAQFPCIYRLLQLALDEGQFVQMQARMLSEGKLHR